jgi:hypothetical protein
MRLPVEASAVQEEIQLFELFSFEPPHCINLVNPLRHTKPGIASRYRADSSLFPAAFSPKNQITIW